MNTLAGVTDLSPRQRQCLALIADGLTDREIARSMGVGVVTAHRHVADVRTKLGARNRAHAVALGYDLALIPREGT